MKRFISFLLCLTLVLTSLPMDGIIARAEEDPACTIDNGYISVQVSKENGGFVVKTEKGDLLKKSDNNKELLFHNGEYDTSFVSFRVEYPGGRTEDYIFGGKYGGYNDPSRQGVTVTQGQENGDITAQWSVGQLTFTETISLANEVSNEHGMVSLSLGVLNKSGSAVKVKARMLLDTCLGDKDFAYYQAIKEDFKINTITSEQILDGEGYSIPQNFYAMDDLYNSGIIAYTVNSPTSMPYQIAFGHWNNLASTLFEFGPDSTLDFTSHYNDYLTADSAYALYYDLGNIANGSTGSFLSYYGVYSRHDVPASDTVAIDAAVPLRLELNSEKTDYIRLSDVGIADFSAAVTFENFASDGSKPLNNVALSVTTTGNIRPLGDTGQAVRDFELPDPFNISYDEVAVGKPISKTLYFDARLCEDAAYERITIGVYDVSSTGGEITSNHKLGEKIVYILLPGSDGGLPKVNFASMTPDIIYCEGTRHLFVTVTNPAMLDNRGNWNLCAYTVDGKNKVEIPHSLISINEGVMDVALTNDIKLAQGSWFLQMEWTDAAVQNNIIESKHQKVTGPQLNFTVSNDKKYKNDSYGVLCVVERTVKNKSEYRLESFKDEADFVRYRDYEKDDYKEILLIFRGEFIAEKSVTDGDGHKEFTYYSAVSTKMLDPATREYKVDNGITINGCMDFEGGNIAVYYENYKIPGEYKKSPILVEFDGELLTSDARTSVWSGKAIFTKIEQGQEYSLRPYDKDGKRKDDFHDKTIQLIWPSVYGMGQTLAGMVFKMAYGELGVMLNSDGSELGRVLSFSASLSLSFMSPKPGAEPRDTYWSKMQEMFKFYTEDQSLYQYAYNGGRINKMLDMSKVNESKDDDRGVSGSVMVQDVLFGCGEGFVGVHFSVGIGIQNFIDNLPKISGTLEVNTINNWALGFAGGMKLATFELEAKLSFKSYNNIPVPDEIYFYMGGFKPGINVDGFGVVWITGGGGGVSNLYDTIFLTQSVPPLKLILTVSFSIVQILDGKCTLSLSLTGISLTGEDLKILGVIEAIKKIYLGLEWYPGIDLRASISVNLFQGIIEGGGYIVLIGKNYTDWFFEMFAHAALKIPKSVPLVGGMAIAAVDLGFNTIKIWGGFEAIGIGIGVTYYWGDDEVDFSTGGNRTKPTFPELLGQEDVPIMYDEERGQTLYARFGTNISPPVAAESIDLSETPRLMAAGLYSDPGLKLHKFNLGTYGAGNNAAIVQISYDADSLDDAKTKAAGFRINSQQDLTADEFLIVFYNGENPDTANANVTFDDETNRAACSFTVTKQENYDKDWYISTGDLPSNVVFYNVAPLPKVETVNGVLNSGNVKLSWDGIGLDELDKISFYLAESDDPEQTEGGRLLTILEDSGIIKDSKNIPVPVPADLPTGNYYIRAVYSKVDEVNGVVFSSGTFHYENMEVPGTCTVSEFTPAGDLKYRLVIDETTDAKTDGYRVAIYNEDGTPTDVADLNYDKSKSGDTAFSIGGSYEFEGKSYGLTGGKSYYAGVSPYHLMDTDGNGEKDAVVYGSETKTETVMLPVPTTPQVTVTTDAKMIKVERMEMRDTDGDEETPAVMVPVIYETYIQRDLDFTVFISEEATGQWGLDDALIPETDGLLTEDETLKKLRGDFTDTKEFQVSLENLTEGGHTLTIMGSDNEGDCFREAYVFDIDTAPPRLMLTTPVNGSMFGKDGKVLISGVTDADAHFTVMADGDTLCENKKLAELGGTMNSEGVFKFTIGIPDPDRSSKRELTICASDAAGNTVVKNVLLTHEGLADLQSLEMLVDGSTLASGNIPGSALAQQRKQLALAGVTKEGTRFRLTDLDNVSWQCHAVEGQAQVDENGVLTIGAGAQGIIVGRLEVARGAYRTAALSFGGEKKSGMVAVTYTLGGKAIGGGDYPVGVTVTLTALPDNGYVFSGWAVAGVAVENPNSAVISFVMPDMGNVTAHAIFKTSSQESDDGRDSYKNKDQDDSYVPPVMTSIYSPAGDIVKIEIPADANPNTTVPFYLAADGSRIYVAMSAVFDGTLYFRAPIDGEYYIVDNCPMFTDTKGHWAEPSMEFMAARMLFVGTGENLFEPDVPVTRAMFITVLHRIAGKPEPNRPAAFSDVPPGIWYEKAAAWGNENGIILGTGGNCFAPGELLTREQMCVMIARYMSFAGINLPEKEAPLSFADASAIESWAVHDVALCQAAGLITGYPDGRFGPKADSTRAENCTLMKRMIESVVKLWLE